MSNIVSDRIPYVTTITNWKETAATLALPMSLPLVPILMPTLLLSMRLLILLFAVAIATAAQKEAAAMKVHDQVTAGYVA